ncbi:MAG: hypothetical protein H8E05_00455 [Bacteroidetes bacterium]|nr:hypothetical protein [Bacteroidota bacterium]
MEENPYIHVYQAIDRHLASVTDGHLEKLKREYPDMDWNEATVRKNMVGNLIQNLTHDYLQEDDETQGTKLAP